MAKRAAAVEDINTVPDHVADSTVSMTAGARVIGADDETPFLTALAVAPRNVMQQEKRISASPKIHYKSFNMHTIELYSGENKPLEPSEEIVLKYVLDWLDKAEISAVIFTNFCLDLTQIDILLGMEGKTFQLEVKGHRGIITGKQNGEWTRLETNGAITSHQNGYRQALAANQVLRDHMRRIVGHDEEVPYPSGVVVFEGNVAHKSTIYSDKRVRICDLDKLTALLSMPESKHGSWPLSWMRILRRRRDSFPVHYGQKESCKTACNPSLTR